MADPSAGAGQEQRSPRVVGRRGHHVDPYRDPWTSSSGIKPRLGPVALRRLAVELDAVVQAERTVVPELETHRRDAPAAPARWARHLTDHVPGGDLGDRLLEGKAALQRLRLLARPGADLRLLGAGGEIGVGLLSGDR